MGLLAVLGWREEVIRSPLAAGRCVQILSQDIDGMFNLLGQKPAIGHVTGRGGALRKRISYRNSFQTVMRLSFEDTATGCRIAARSFMSAYAAIFMLVWLGIVGSALTMTIGSFGQARADPFVVVIPLFMLAFGIGLVVFCRWLARDEHAFLLDFVLTRVDGRLEPPPAEHRSGQIVT